jgi:probable rRNA maturation factor
VADKILIAACKVLNIDLDSVYANFSFVSKRIIKELNNKFRGVSKVTDVLSFPNGDIDPETERKFLGDVLICRAAAKEQAEELGQSEEEEITFLKIHGLLHLLGCDHENEEDEKNMIAKQKEILLVLKGAEENK